MKTVQVLVLKPTVVNNDQLTVGYVYTVDKEVAAPLIASNHLAEVKVKTVKE